eukprot:TRINITY_DN17637_c0_g1_i1.p1 TRINITY_DN17637_c0_g1~~TRINITY_DN17637_c0_g1_i1.p1  ORF type:complete len:528 (+),score=89.09 TRINITY_DN17637_c0_g1_i1:36-1586(+)
MSSRYTSDAVSGTQIVQAYKAKKAAQMERARLLKLERDMKKTEDALMEQPVNAYTAQSTDRSHSHMDPPTSRSLKPQQPITVSRQTVSHQTVSHQTVSVSSQPVSQRTVSVSEPTPSAGSVLVGEADLVKAVHAGIITMDQCRKLWETFQQVGTPAPANTDTAKEREHIGTPSSRYRSSHSQQQVQMPPSPVQLQRDPLNDPTRMRAQIDEAQARDQVTDAGYGGSWNMDTDISYNDPEDDETFIRKQRKPGTTVAKPKPKDSRMQHSEWQVDVDMTSGGFGEPPKLPSRRVPAKKSAVRTTATKTRSGSNVGGYSALGSGDYMKGGYDAQASAPHNAYAEMSIPTTTVDLDSLPTNAVSNMLDIEAQAMAAAEEPQYPCSQCGRSFRQAVLVRHQKTCGHQRQRKVFDASKSREIPEQRDVPKSYATPPPAASNKSKASWKEQHEQFQAAMKNNKLVRQVESGALPASALATVPQPPDNRVPCPHCTRKFAPDVAERHIPKCKNILAKPKSLRRY